MLDVAYQSNKVEKNMKRVFFALLILTAAPAFAQFQAGGFAPRDYAKEEQDREDAEQRFLPADAWRVVQGKRVRKDCPLTAEERRALITHGPARVVAMIRDRLGCSLRQAKDLYDSAK